MEQLNKLFSETLKMPWLANVWGLLAVVAVALALILIIAVIASAVSGGKKKKQIKKLETKLKNAGRPSDTLETNNELRAELEQSIREEVKDAVRKETETELRARIENEVREEYAMGAPTDTAVNERELRDKIEAEVRSEYAELYATSSPAEQNDESVRLQAQVEELQATIDEKNARIDELGELLMQSGTDRQSDNGELYVRINELNQSNTELQKQVNALKAENAKLKNSSAARTSTKRTAEPKATPAVKTKTIEPVVFDDDDADEVYNDYGDSTSAVKVTLKYDRVKSSWVIYRSDTTRAYRRIGTKQEALVVAKDLAKRLHAQLVVHKKDGKFQKL